MTISPHYCLKMLTFLRKQRKHVSRCILFLCIWRTLPLFWADNAAPTVCVPHTVRALTSIRLSAHHRPCTDKPEMGYSIYIIGDQTAAQKRKVTDPNNEFCDLTQKVPLFPFHQSKYMLHGWKATFILFNKQCDFYFCELACEFAIQFSGTTPEEKWQNVAWPPLKRDNFRRKLLFKMKKCPSLPSHFWLENILFRKRNTYTLKCRATLYV